MPQTAKARTAQFTKRKTSMMKKAYQLGRLCNADVALIIRKNGIYYTYRSTDRTSWPPTTKEIHESYPLPRQLRPEDYEGIKKPTAIKEVDDRIAPPSPTPTNSLTTTDSSYTAKASVEKSSEGLVDSYELKWTAPLTPSSSDTELCNE